MFIECWCSVKLTLVHSFPVSGPRSSELPSPSQGLSWSCIKGTVDHHHLSTAGQGSPLSPGDSWNRLGRGRGEGSGEPAPLHLLPAAR